jgi:hypothetical protein
MKENKYYTHVNFFLPFAYVMILGFFFNESTDKVDLSYYAISVFSHHNLHIMDFLPVYAVSFSG